MLCSRSDLLTQFLRMHSSVLSMYFVDGCHLIAFPYRFFCCSVSTFVYYGYEKQGSMESRDGYILWFSRLGPQMLHMCPDSVPSLLLGMPTQRRWRGREACPCNPCEPDPPNHSKCPSLVEWLEQDWDKRRGQSVSGVSNL